MARAVLQSYYAHSSTNSMTLIIIHTTNSTPNTTLIIIHTTVGGAGATIGATIGVTIGDTGGHYRYNYWWYRWVLSVQLSVLPPLEYFYNHIYTHDNTANADSAQDNNANANFARQKGKIKCISLDIVISTYCICYIHFFAL